MTKITQAEEIKRILNGYDGDIHFALVRLVRLEKFFKKMKSTSREIMQAGVEVDEA